MIAWRQSPVLLEVTTKARYFLVEVEVGRNHMMSNEKTHVFGVEMREVNRFFPFFFLTTGNTYAYFSSDADAGSHIIISSKALLLRDIVVKH